MRSCCILISNSGDEYKSPGNIDWSFNHQHKTNWQVSTKNYSTKKHHLSPTVPQESNIIDGKKNYIIPVDEISHI